MADRDVQRPEPLTQETAGNVRGDVPSPRELSCRRFDGDLPGRCRADEDLRRLIGDQPAPPRGEPTVTVEPPKEGVCVEEKAQGSEPPGLQIGLGKRLEEGGRHASAPPISAEAASR